jgi:predicted CXXCH cytochrome family protein
MAIMNSVGNLSRTRIAGLAAVLAIVLQFAVFPALAQDAAATDVLAEWDIPVTGGAAAGYVPDSACATCHSDKAESFADVGMAKSFYRPSAAKVIEDFDNNRYYQEATDRYYEMELRGDDYWFRRFQIAPDGERINVFERRVDWILGSGHHSRVYLYRTDDGRMFQLPLAWYSQDGKWAMSPGFEFAPHLGVQRSVRRRCMFCHNAFPEVPVGSDAYEMPETIPEDLPEGIGCQRCHGPGARHVALAISGEVELEETRDAIVNPGKLPREKLYSICYGCHMQPNVAVPAEVRFGRDDYSFRPAQDLADYVAQIEIVDAKRPRQERFEINHHPYRLEQSQCFIESKGELGCLTCHDPHRKIAPEQRASHYRAACLSCHETDDGGIPVALTAGAEHPPIGVDDDCTSCHMPRRRTQDVVDVWMTDHRIVRDPGPADLLAPIAKESAEVTEIYLKDPEADLTPDEALLHKAMAILHYSSWNADYAADAIWRTLKRDPGSRFEPWHDLAKSLVAGKRYSDALSVVEEAEKRAPGHPEILEMLGLSKFGSGDKEGGIAVLKDLLAKNPSLADPHYNLAVLLVDSGDADAAIGELRTALSLRDNMWTAWRLIGDIESRRNNHEAAAEAYRAALAIEPDAPRPRKGLVAALEKLGRMEDAARYRRAGEE